MNVFGEFNILGVLAFSIVTLVVFGVIMTVLEKVFRSNKDQKTFRGGYLTDIGYWLLTPIVGAAIKAFVSVPLVIFGVSAIWSHTVSPAEVTKGFGPAADFAYAGPWQAVLAVIAMLLINDFMLYWTHRMMHRSVFWPYHAVHHSPEELDYLVSLRTHPVNLLIVNPIKFFPAVFLGFPIEFLLITAPILIFHGLLVHANLDWDFGPFRRIVASPRFHRWHHTSEAEGLDKNFGGTFAFWDYLFGTAYMPKDRRATRFGTLGEEVPYHLPGQLLFPFRAGLKKAKVASQKAAKVPGGDTI